MTAPTPEADFNYDTIYEDGRADGYEAGRDELAHALAAVTAERDQARQMLADAPHGDDCQALSAWSKALQSTDECSCWKAGL